MARHSGMEFISERLDDAPPSCSTNCSTMMKTFCLTYLVDTMAHIRSPKNESITFRLDPALKVALNDLAQHEGKSLGEFLRELARDRIRQARRLSFEREAQRQSIAAAAAAGRPGTDEHAVMQELDDDLESFGDEWT